MKPDLLAAMTLDVAPKGGFDDGRQRLATLGSDGFRLVPHVVRYADVAAWGLSGGWSGHAHSVGTKTLDYQPLPSCAPVSAVPNCRYRNKERPGGTEMNATATDLVAEIDACEYWIKASIEVASVADAKALAAQFPKAIGLRALRLLGGPTEASGIVEFQARISADGVNGGTNEAGIKRYRSFRKHLDRHGIEVNWRMRYANAWTEAELEAHLA